MSSRLLWFGAGAVAAVYARTRVRRTAEQFSAHGLVDRLSAVGAGLRFFAGEVQAGMAERERQLRDSLGVEDTSFRRMLLAEIKPSQPHEDIA